MKDLLNELIKDTISFLKKEKESIYFSTEKEAEAFFPQTPKPFEIKQTIYQEHPYIPPNNKGVSNEIPLKQTPQPFLSKDTTNTFKQLFPEKILDEDIFEKENTFSILILHSEEEEEKIDFLKKVRKAIHNNFLYKTTLMHIKDFPSLENIKLILITKNAYEKTNNKDQLETKKILLMENINLYLSDIKYKKILWSSIKESIRCK